MLLSRSRQNLSNFSKIFVKHASRVHIRTVYMLEVFMKEEQQEQFDRFVDEIISCGKKENGEPLKIHFYEEAQPWLVELLKKAGLDIEGFNHSLTDENIIHNLKNHSNPALERKSGNIAITSEDLKYIPQIINEPDIVYAGLKRYKQNPDHIAYLKYNNNATDIFIERIFPGSKELRSATRYKKPKHITKEKFIKILGMNEKTDVSNAVYIEKKKLTGKLWRHRRPAGVVQLLKSRRWQPLPPHRQAAL